jgi:biotin synthase
MRDPSARRPSSAQRWSADDILSLLESPFPELIYRAQSVHRMHFDPAEVQLSTLLSVKTGGCHEDCGYCPQSRHHAAGVADEPLLALEDVLQAARAAKDQGAGRFCMGAAWRSPKARDLEPVLAMIAGVKALGLETCATLGMLKEGQAEALKAAGLDYYNHNLDTSPEFYASVVSTRTYEDRLETLERVRAAGMHVCCGGIVGMGETRRDRAALLAQLANLEPYPESVPINDLVRVEGTPLAAAAPLDELEFVRTVAAARIAMPSARVRLSAGRERMSDAAQALCFVAGANSIFLGEKLLTTVNPALDRDRSLFERLGLRAATTT